jgi:hypothetical protein
MMTQQNIAASAAESMSPPTEMDAFGKATQVPIEE